MSSSDPDKRGTFRQLCEDDVARLNHRQIGCTNPAFQADTDTPSVTSPINARVAPTLDTAPNKTIEESRNLFTHKHTCWKSAISSFKCIFKLPCCPARSRVARLAALWFMVLAAWGMVYLLVGQDAAPPAGQLWLLGVLAVVAKFGGWLSVQMKLPGLLGMLLAGMALQAAGVVQVEGPYLGLVRVIRKASLVIIMMRAGLDLDPTAARRLRFTILRLGLLPWALEASCVAVLSNLLFSLPWSWAFMLGVVEAAVSPAVVVPHLILLRQKGFGIAKGVPTLVLAVTGIEDAAAISAFGVITSVMFTAGSLAFTIAQGPLSILVGMVGGILLGFLSRIIPDKSDPYVISLRVFVLLLGGLLSVLGFDRAGLGGAGPLAVIVAAFVAGSGWAGQGWRVGENQVALTFGVIWQFFEPIVFGLVGAQIRVSELPANTVGLAAACILGPALVRFSFTLILLCGSVLNLKEKFFVALAWMAKATVQAVLGPTALDLVRDSKDADSVANAQIVFIVCVLSILLTAPLGAVLIATTGPRLLQREPPATEPPPSQQQK